MTRLESQRSSTTVMKSQSTRSSASNPSESNSLDPNSYADSTDGELDRLLLQTLHEYFGYDAFLPGQIEVMRSLLRGHSSAAVFPTGGGKSLCYQIPSLLLPGVTLVVSPLIALMKDQIDALTKRGIAAIRLDSTLSADEYRGAVERLRSGELHMLYVAPERFNNERFRELVQQVPVSLFAVDEAHCISEWGHAFRPDYLKLAHFADASGAERTLALTATATPKVLDDICSEFKIQPEHAIRTGFYRANLTLEMTSVNAADRDQALIERLKERTRGATVVYVTLQKTTVSLAKKLVAAGMDAKPYHAGLKSDVRAETQDWFLNRDNSVIVATIAFGMGIDKSDIRYVYHYNLPKSLENYSQEIGRAGRDGEPSVCESLVCADDLRVLENFVYGDTPDHGSVTELVTHLFGQGESFSISLHRLSGDFNIRSLVLRTLLTYLELDGYLQGGTPRYGEYRFKPLTDSQSILADFSPERQAFLKGIFRQARKSSVWFDIDVDQTALALDTDRSRVIRALDYMADQGWLELKTSQVLHCYWRLKMPDDLAGLAHSLYDRCLRRQDQELGRLGEQMAWFAHAGCQTNALARHFGEARADDCGHCHWCQSKSPFEVGVVQAATIDEQQWQQALRFRQAHAEALRSPSEFARFLCGVRSPSITREKLARDPLFGSFEEVPFAEVVRRAS